MGRNAFPDEDTVPMYARITIEAQDALRVLSSITKIPMNRLLDTAIRDLVVGYIAKEGKDPALRTHLAAATSPRKAEHAAALDALFDMDPAL